MIEQYDIPARLEQETGAIKAPKLAKYLGVSRTTIYDMATAGRIPHYRYNGSIRFDPATVAAWLRTRAVVTIPSR